MFKVAVLGANGQVGTEVSLLLKNWGGIEVSAFCRSQLSSVVLRRLGIKCCQFDPASAQSRAELGQANLIIDFTLPSGTYREITREYKRIYQGVLACLPKEVVYISASSQMAFGFGGTTKRIKRYWVSRTVYGATKRYAERCLKRFATAKGNPLYIFRLAQVHGLIQSCSLSMREIALNHPSINVIAGPSHTVFCFSIAEAIVNILHEKELPGTYTLESTPPWTWQEVLSFLAGRPIICNENRAPTVGNPLSLVLPHISSLGTKMNEPIQVYFLRWFPQFEARLRDTKRRLNSRHVLAQLNSPQGYNMDLMWGKLPGARLRSLTDSRLTMLEHWNRCMASINGIHRCA